MEAENSVKELRLEVEGKIAELKTVREEMGSKEGEVDEGQK